MIEAYRLRLPIYHTDVDPLLVRMLSKDYLCAVHGMSHFSSQYGRVHCTNMAARTVDPLACTYVMYDDHTIDTLPDCRIPKLDTLIVRNKAWDK